MQRLYFRLFLFMLTLLLAGCASLTRAQTLEDDQISTTLPEVTATTQIEVDLSVPPADCPVTIAMENDPFKAPEPYSPDAPWGGMFWYGTEHLWTALDADGVWEALPNNPEGYTQKIFWWSELYVLKDELEPALEVMGRRLDAESPPLKTYGATNASAGDIGDAMLTGVDFPTLGCWEITAHYKKSGLTFVVWVAP
jgi:hypothetical protein